MYYSQTDYCLENLSSYNCFIRYQYKRFSVAINLKTKIFFNLKVINYTLPQTMKQYVHRVGRTARIMNVGR